MPEGSYWKCLLATWTDSVDAPSRTPKNVNDGAHTSLIIIIIEYSVNLQDAISITSIGISVLLGNIGQSSRKPVTETATWADMEKDVLLPIMSQVAPLLPATVHCLATPS